MRTPVEIFSIGQRNTTHKHTHRSPPPLFWIQQKVTGWTSDCGILQTNHGLALLPCFCIVSFFPPYFFSSFSLFSSPLSGTGTGHTLLRPWDMLYWTVLYCLSDLAERWCTINNQPKEENPDEERVYGLRFFLTSFLLVGGGRGQRN